jgi:hypothetical protein
MLYGRLEHRYFIMKIDHILCALQLCFEDSSSDIIEISKHTSRGFSMNLNSVYWKQLREISYGHTDKITVTIIKNEEPLEVERFNSLELIRNYPNATSICIAGLKQLDFDRFNHEYAAQFTNIHYWKCPLVADLSSLGGLSKVEYMTYFWNQRSTRLWDMSGNESLRGLLIDAFSRMHKLDDVCSAPVLNDFWVHSGYSLSHYFVNSLWPLVKCASLEDLRLIVHVIDQDPMPLLHMPKLKNLLFSEDLFTTEQIAMLKALLPDVECELFVPYIIWGEESEEKNVKVTGKRKPFLHSVRDADRLEKYKKQFFDLVEKYKSEQPH